MKKVVYFIDHLRADGTQTFLYHLVHGLAMRGWQQGVVCLNDSWDDALVAQLRQIGTEVRIIGRRNLITAIGLWSTMLWLRHRRFDTAVTLLFHSDVLGRPLVRLAGVPRVITSLRSRNVHYAAWQRLLSRLTMPLADTVVLNAEHIREFALLEEGVASAQVVVIPNGVQTQLDTPALTRQEVGLPTDGRLIGYLGRLSHEKGPDLLLNAFAHLANPNVHLIFIGQGSDQAALQQAAHTLGIAERVHFVGQQRDPIRWLRLLDVYVHPSRQEGMSNAVLEAMATGCPIVASAIDGNQELINDHIGWLVPPNDPQALTAAIQEVLANPDEAEQRGSAARQRVAYAFSLDVMIDAWERILLLSPDHTLHDG